MKKLKTPTAPKADKPPSGKTYVSEAHSYDVNRKKRPIQSRYSGAGAAY